MIYSEPARTARRTRSIVLAVLVVANVALVGHLVNQALASSSSAASSTDVRQGDRQGSAGEAGGAVPDDIPQGDRQGAPGEADGVVDEADGVVPDGLTVFDDELPAVANLDPELLGALRQAATDAADDGVELSVTSGWRSAEYQEQLLQEAIAEYGSEEEASRWVATPETSAHVSGDAVDIGPTEAVAWLSDDGAEYGLCQIYGNEPWHYELRPEAVGDSCPPMYADPTHDPRMQP
jgi:zinc D-Ala-D-Ala carboxypeptidase